MNPSFTQNLQKFMELKCPKRLLARLFLGFFGLWNNAFFLYINVTKTPINEGIFQP